jgi:hypothetical protein
MGDISEGVADKKIYKKYPLSMHLLDQDIGLETCHVLLTDSSEKKTNSNTVYTANIYERDFHSTQIAPQVHNNEQRLIRNCTLCLSYVSFT